MAAALITVLTLFSCSVTAATISGFGPGPRLTRSSCTFLWRDRGRDFGLAQARGSLVLAALFYGLAAATMPASPRPRLTMVDRRSSDELAAATVPPKITLTWAAAQLVWQNCF